jgi:hypothetical protein
MLILDCEIALIEIISTFARLSKNDMKLRISCLLLLVACFGSAQTNNPFTSRMYCAWGYNAEWFTSSTIKISQPALGNNYELKNITGNDNPGWNFQLFKKPLTVPQYNYRFGFFLKKHPSWGFELGFDHTKFQLTIGENIHWVGTVNNRHLDTNLNVVDSYFHWKLNNGANFFCFNVMKRFYLCGTKNGHFKLFNIYKFGAGPTVPHVENTLMGMPNNAHFQPGGWNVGFEANYRLEIYDYLYVDIAQKIDYARYFGLRCYDGTAKQAFGTYEVMATLGFMLPYKPFWVKDKKTAVQPAAATNN